MNASHLSNINQEKNFEELFKIFRINKIFRLLNFYKIKHKSTQISLYIQEKSTVEGNGKSFTIKGFYRQTKNYQSSH